MLTEICKEIKNWFEKTKHHGKFKIENHVISGNVEFNILDGQYFRIIGSVFNDGVYKNTAEDLAKLKDEEFDGSLWTLAIPKDIIDLDTKISDWITQYGGANNSPFSSESFGGYSYSKSTGTDANGNSVAGWKSAFADELNRWRKI